MKLYHYTDLNGLKGIVESQSLWATSLLFLNDSEELKHGMQCIRNALPKFNGDMPSTYIDNVIKAMDRYGDKLSKNVYNISFCQEPELLSQWRGYSNTHGVCLEFDLDNLLNTLDFECCNAFHSEVIYCSRGEPLKAETELKNFFDDIRRGGELSRNHASKFASQATPFFKNDSFSEEKEYRLVVYPHVGFQDVRFRTSKNGLIPYIELKTKQQRGQKIPIDKVTIAPSSNAEFMRDGIRFFLDYHFYKSTKVEASLTPYRG